MRFYLKPLVIDAIMKFIKEKEQDISYVLAKKLVKMYNSKDTGRHLDEIVAWTIFQAGEQNLHNKATFLRTIENLHLTKEDLQFAPIIRRATELREGGMNLHTFLSNFDTGVYIPEEKAGPDVWVQTEKCLLLIGNKTSRCGPVASSIVQKNASTTDLETLFVDKNENAPPIRYQVHKHLYQRWKDKRMSTIIRIHIVLPGGRDFKPSWSVQETKKELEIAPNEYASITVTEVIVNIDSTNIESTGLFGTNVILCFKGCWPTLSKH